MKHKASVINNIIHRAKIITSDELQKVQEIQNINLNLTKNGNSSSFMNKTVNKPPSSDNSIENASRHFTLNSLYRRSFSKYSSIISTHDFPHHAAINFKPNFTVKNTVTKIKVECHESKKLIYS